MPKITGPNIAQHVADQEAAVFEAAIALFEAHGVDGVSMGTIAEEVGLARSSLYRYFPNKAAIVNRWSSTAMAPLIDQCDRVARSDGSQTERFTAWLELQFAFLSEPANQTMIHAALESNELDDAQRDEIAARHRRLYGTLQTIIGGPGSDTDVVVRARVGLIVGLFRNLDSLQRSGIPYAVIHDEVVRVATLVAALT